MPRIRGVGAVAAVHVAAVVGVASPAVADHTIDSGYTYVGTGNSQQFLYWNQSTEHVRLRVHASGGMSSDRCIDAFFDWRTSNGAHSDGRVIRVCKPGGDLQTDSSGDGFWDEAGWQSRNPDGMQRAGGYLIDDDFTGGGNDGDTTAVYEQERVIANHGSHPPQHPVTRTAWWARVKTLYQDGSVKWSQDYSRPFDCGQEDTWPWSCP